MTKSSSPRQTATDTPSMESLLEEAKQQFVKNFAARFFGKNTDEKIKNAIPDFIAYDNAGTANALYEAFFSSGLHKNLAPLYRIEDQYQPPSPLYKYLEQGLRAEAFKQLSAVLPEEMRPQREHESVYGQSDQEIRKREAHRFLKQMQERDESIDVHTYTHQVLTQLDGWIKECVPDSATCRQMLDDMNRGLPILTETQDRMKDGILNEIARRMSISHPNKVLERTVEYGLLETAKLVTADVLTRHPAVSEHIKKENSLQFTEGFFVLPVLQQAFFESAHHLGMKNNPCEGEVPPAMELPVGDAEWTAFNEDLKHTVTAIMPRSLEIQSRLDQVNRTRVKGGIRLYS